jgi:HD-like signal output (HDOD) protein
VEFLEGFLIPASVRHLDEVPRTDRLFLGGIVRRLHARQLDLPVFPEAAVRVSGLLRQSNVPISRYVALLTEDPALSLEVLRAANSAFYGAATRTASLHEAIVRIGLSRLESILLMAHLKSRVMKGVSQRKAELLLDLALPTAALASRFAPQQTASDLRFMRGMLMHAEHLVILGTIPDISREHRTVIAPSADALHQAFAQFGPEVREALASAWTLGDILIAAEAEQGALEVYTGLRDALVCRWLDRRLPDVPGVEPDRLAEALVHVPPRVRPVPKEPSEAPTPA